MTAFSALVLDCRELIGDTGATVFTADQVKQWVNDAIKQMSIFFPRRLTVDIACTTAQRKYDIAQAIVSVLSVRVSGRPEPPGLLPASRIHSPRFLDSKMVITAWSNAWMPILLLMPLLKAMAIPSQIWVSRKHSAPERQSDSNTRQSTTICQPMTDILTVLPTPRTSDPPVRPLEGLVRAGHHRRHGPRSYRSAQRHLSKSTPPEQNAAICRLSKMHSKPNPIPARLTCGWISGTGFIDRLDLVTVIQEAKLLNEA